MSSANRHFHKFADLNNLLELLTFRKFGVLRICWLQVTTAIPQLSDSPTRRMESRQLPDSPSQVSPICDSTSRGVASSPTRRGGVNDSPTHQKGEFYFKHSIADSPTRQVRESSTPRLAKSESQHPRLAELESSNSLTCRVRESVIPDWPSRRVDNSWLTELGCCRLDESGSCRLSDSAWGSRWLSDSPKRGVFF
jgi:hypothetical protein